ncbi:DNA glycosylase [Novimethylophilus kurashikiensis]|uniref:DNA glycosylase n=1 Tax=Novimethylophilus kurashikiensis TaxID=1825523 RepID=A0A2R5F7T5_9PROT|nr:YjfB family protein [Novimethylophilus kurashikiensis]GBG12741.1 DNA glycosylase [Novimethylophilus kurashikiensis]
MDVSGIANLATQMSAAQTNAEVSIAVLKKAINIEAQGALALLDAVPLPQNLPAHLGQNVNTTA